MPQCHIGGHGMWLAVIATPVGGIPEIVVSPSVGTLVDRTLEAFEQAIDESLCRQWNYAAIIAHSQTYNWPSVASEILNIYSEVLTRRSPQRSRSLQPV